MSDMECLEALSKKIDEIEFWRVYLTGKMNHIGEEIEDVKMLTNALLLRAKEEEEKKKRKACLFIKLCCRRKCHED